MNYENDIKTIFANNLFVARRTNGYSQEEVADGANISKQSISKYESKQMIPNMKVIHELSTFFQVQEDYWFNKDNAFEKFKQTWDQFATNADFENVKYREEVKIENDQIINEVKKEAFKKFLSYENLESIMNSRVVFKNPLASLKIKSKQDAHDAAIMLRKAWKLYSNPIANVIALLESKGIRVIEVNVHESFEGLSARLEKFPVIVVNAKMLEVTRKRFTALHELGHLTLEMDTDNYELIERICDQFAATMLLPKELLFSELGESRSKVFPEDIIAIKEKYGISYLAIIISALFSNIIDQSQYEILKEANKSTQGVYNNQESPTRFKRLLIQAYREERISKERVQKLSEMSGEIIELEAD